MPQPLHTTRSHGLEEGSVMETGGGGHKEVSLNRLIISKKALESIDVRHTSHQTKVEKCFIGVCV